MYRLSDIRPIVNGSFSSQGVVTHRWGTTEVECALVRQAEAGFLGRKRRKEAETKDESRLLFVLLRFLVSEAS